MASLLDVVKRFGYDRRLGPMGSVTYAGDATAPLATPLVPMAPGFVQVPKDRELTPEEVTHEGYHVSGGLPMSMLGTLASKLFGIDRTAGYMSPDEVAAYLSQDPSPATSSDARTLEAIATTSKEGSPLYKAIVAKLARAKQGQGQPDRFVSR